MLKYSFLTLIFTLLFLSLCCKNGPTKPDDSTLSPNANAGADQTSFVGSYIMLDPSASTAGDGDTLIYSWAADAGNPVQQLFSPFLKNPVIGFTAEGTYHFILTVNNGKVNSVPDIMEVRVGPRQQQIFTDPKLEITVRYKLGKPTGDLLSSDLLLIDTLQAFNYYADGITSLAGIEQCTNLVWLGCTLQKIKDISPLSMLTNLRRLSLSQNREIESISPLANLINLQSLDLESNKINDITPLTNLNSLTYLNIMYNPIDDISPLSNMLQLEELYLNSSSSSPVNGVSVIGNFTNLKILWITHFGLADISPFSNLKNLRLLHIGVNNVEDLSPISGCSELERLYADMNQISNLTPLQNLSKLAVLDLVINKITNIQPLVDNPGLSSGDAVGLQGNSLDSISVNQYIPALKNRGVFVFWP